MNASDNRIDRVMPKRAACYLIVFSVAAAASSQPAEVAPGEKLLYDRIHGSRWNSYAIARPSAEDGVYQLSSFDRRRAERLANGHYKVWIRDDFSSTQNWTAYGISHEYDWIIEQQEVNCRQVETLTLRRLLYKDAGNGDAHPTWDWTARTKADREWEAMVPDSHGEMSVKLLCQSLRNISR